MLNNKTKDRYRRAIRVIMIVLAVVLLIMGLAVPIANNAIAMRQAKALKALTPTEYAIALETTSLAGRFTKTAGHVQYFSAVLIKSDRSLEELQTYYMQYSKTLFDAYCVQPQNGQEIVVLEGVDLAFRQTVGEKGHYIVYSICTGGNTAQWWLDMDVR